MRWLAKRAPGLLTPSGLVWQWESADGRRTGGEGVRMAAWFDGQLVTIGEALKDARLSTWGAVEAAARSVALAIEAMAEVHSQKQWLGEVDLVVVLKTGGRRAVTAHAGGLVLSGLSNSNFRAKVEDAGRCNVGWATGQDLTPAQAWDRLALYDKVRGLTRELLDSMRAAVEGRLWEGMTAAGLQQELEAAVEPVSLNVAAARSGTAWLEARWWRRLADYADVWGTRDMYDRDRGRCLDRALATAQLRGGDGEGVELGRLLALAAGGLAEEQWEWAQMCRKVRGIARFAKLPAVDDAKP